MCRGKKPARRGGTSNQVRVQNTTRNRPITRKQSALLVCEEVQNNEHDEKFALIELTLNNKLLVVKHSDLIKWNESVKIKLGSKQQYLDELNIIKGQRNNKENVNFDNTVDDDDDDLHLVTTTALTESTQKFVQYGNANISEVTDSDISIDNIQSKSDFYSSSSISSRTKPSASNSLQLNHNQNTTSTAASLTLTNDITVTSPKSPPLVINANTSNTTANLQSGRMDPLSDLTRQLNEVTEDRDKWKMIPIDVNVCEWICTMCDAVQRQVNSDINFNDEARKLNISPGLLKYCVNLSKLTTVTARKLFQQVCLNELTEGTSWSGISTNKIDAINAFGEKNQLDSETNISSLNQQRFQDHGQMNVEDFYEANDKDQCSLLFDHDNTFYDTIINATPYDFEKNKLTSSEEIDNEATEMMYSTDEEEISDEEVIDQTETDTIYQKDKYDNEQENDSLHYQFQREHDEIDISVCLLTLKTKHNLTLECLNDIRKLLISLKVKNVPSSIYHICKLINTTNKSTTTTTSSTRVTSSMIICQKCERVSLSKEYCSHVDCDNRIKYEINPYNYICLDIHHQLQQIFYHEEHIKYFTFNNEPCVNSMRDVYDGEVYRSLLGKVETNEINFITTLIMNIDGIAIGNSTQESLWIITCAINEIKRRERFKIHNAIIAGICSCFKKPTRTIMGLLLKPIVDQLIQLEKHHLFQMKAYHNEYRLIRTYLIGVCNDKPANSLVQNAPEPIAKFGCTTCEIPGEVVLSNSDKQISHNKTSSTNKKKRIDTHKIRVFPTSEDDQTQLRSTVRCEQILDQLAKVQHNNYPVTNEEKSNLQLGYLGKCVLTELSYFDHGHSFLMDTLHTIYHGAFKRLLKLWFHSKYRTQQWSIRQHLNHIETELRQFRFPSTTTRIPRTIMKYHRLKANELRVLLLITYPTFKKYLKPIYYKHLQLLSFALHIGESREITSSKLNEMKILLDKFVFTFHFLYGKRHAVNTVHSVVHFHQTVKHYGPLTNYSTFNYESLIGNLSHLTATINGTKHLPREIENNIELIKNSSFLGDTYCMSSSLYPLISEIQGYKTKLSVTSNSYQLQKPTSIIHKNDKHELFLKFGKELSLYNKCNIKGVTFTTLHYSKSKQFQDCAILYRRENIHCFGLINKIILITTSNNVLLQIYPLHDNRKDEILLNFNTQKILCDNVEFGTIDFDHHIHINVDDVIEK
ncbi:unnamed protein product, partial [Rotaria sordida]